MRRLWFALVAFAFTSFHLLAADDFRTVDTAISAKVQPAAAPTPTTVPGHLGVHVAANSKGQLVVEDLQPESPAEKAGLKIDDLITHLEGKHVATADGFRAELQSSAAGDSIKLGVTRQEKSIDFTVKLTPVSRPMPPGRTGPAPLGVQVAAVKDGDGVT